MWQCNLFYLPMLKLFGYLGQGDSLQFQTILWNPHHSRSKFTTGLFYFNMHMYVVFREMVSYLNCLAGIHSSRPSKNNLGGSYSPCMCNWQDCLSHNPVLTREFFFFFLVVCQLYSHWSPCSYHPPRWFLCWTAFNHCPTCFVSGLVNTDYGLDCDPFKPFLRLPPRARLSVWKWYFRNSKKYIPIIVAKIEEAKVFH